jgi:hypothetical protein
MAQASRKVIVPDVDLEETTLASPRFDETAAQQARPVVPLSKDAGYTQVAQTTVRSAQPSYLPARKGPWLLAAFVGLVLGAAAMAVGVAAYRRSHAVSTQALSTAAAAERPELNQDFRPRPSSRPVAPAQQTVSNEAKPGSGDNASNATAAAEAPAPKSVKRRPVTTNAPAESVSSEDRAAENDSSGKPRPRLVDKYVIRSSRP